MSSGIRILLVDDNPDDRMLAGRALQAGLTDAAIVEVTDPDSFGRVLDAGDFDVVLTDFQLKWTNGLSVLEAVRSRYTDRPVVMFTNTGSEQICAEAMRKGLHDYVLKKPGSYAKLPAAVLSAMDVVRMRRDLLAKDVELARLLESEKRARLAAEEASRMKDEFLSTLSHELRTPLNVISGWTQILQLAPPSREELEEGLAIIARSVEQQTKLIADLLDMSRIVSGKLRLQLQQVLPSEAVDAAIDSVAHAAAAKSISIEKSYDPAAGPIMADPARLQQIVWNLLSNAIRFTSNHGKIRIAVKRVGAHDEIVVSDDGEGIDPAFLPHVFDRLRPADNSITRRHGGMGVGLSMVKYLSEMHGGTVSVASEGKGHGATFVVSLPIASGQ
jgi:signal transduction histidine kinase